MPKCTAKQAITEALRWVGYQEKASDKDLYHKTKNAGSNNYTCFQPMVTNGKNGDFWCMYYQDAIVKTACGGDQKAACEVLRLPYEEEMSGYTPDAKNAYLRAGQYYDTPELGDQVLFYSTSKGRIAHIGMVTNILRDTMEFDSAEGNTSSTEYSRNGGCVAIHRYSYAKGNVGGTNYVNGFGRPDYAPETATTTKNNVHIESFDEFVRLLYTNVLARTPSSSEIKVWTDALRNGSDPTSVLKRIVMSTERQQQLIALLYLALLERPAHKEEIQKWVARKLDASGLVHGIIESNEYKDLQRKEID